MKNLTKGSILKQIVSFALPYFIASLFQQLYNLVDMVIVGRTLGQMAYTAVGATGSLTWFTIGTVQSLTHGFSVITAQRYGAGDEEGVKQSFGTAIRLSVFISVIASLGFALLARQLLEIMQTPADIIDRSYNYLVWIYAGTFAGVIYNLLAAMMRAIGDSRTPLYFLVLSSILNVGLDLLFIVGFGMDTEGAGIATVLAQLISGICCVVYIKKKYPALHIGLRHLAANKNMRRALLRIGVPMAFLNMVLSFGEIIAQFVTNGLGTLYVLARSTASRITGIVGIPIGAIGSALAVFVAQNFGARKYSRIVAAGRVSYALCFAMNVLIFLALLLFSDTFVTLLVGELEPSVLGNARISILIFAGFNFLLSAVFVIKQSLQAVGEATVTVISGISEIVGRITVSLLALAMINQGFISGDLGFIIVCLATPVAWVLGISTMIYSYVKMVRRFKQLAAQEAEEDEELAEIVD